MCNLIYHIRSIFAQRSVPGSCRPIGSPGGTFLSVLFNRMDAVTSIFAPLCRPFVEHRDILCGGWRNRIRQATGAAARRSRSPQYKLRSLAAEGYLPEWPDGTSTVVRVFRHCDRLVGDGWEYAFIVRLRTIESGGEQHCQEFCVEW